MPSKWQFYVLMVLRLFGRLMLTISELKSCRLKEDLCWKE
jgi:hypothetical protein